MGDRLRVLVVEDEASVQDLLDVVLQEAGFAVTVVGTGQAALDVLAAERFDVVVLDKNLPGISGIDVLRRLRKSDRATGAIMATGYASEQSARDALNLGIDGYLTKPFNDITDVVVCVRAAAAACKRRRGGAASSTARDVVLACADPGLCDLLRSSVPRSSKVRIADTAAALLEDARSSPAAVYVVDADLEREGVVDVMRRLREAAPDAACFVLTGSEPLSVLLALIDLGVRGVIDKPVDLIDVRGRIELSIHSQARSY